MILTCPECATSYFVDESRIPSTGRKVRCSTCGHRWTAGPDGQVIEPPVAFPQAAPQPETDAETEEDASDLVAVEPDPAPIVAPLTPRAQTSRRRGRGEERPSRAIAWAGAAALVAAVIAAAIVFREQVVRRIPATAPVYAGLGLELSGRGLVLERVRAQAAFLGGRPVLSVTGAIRNPRGAVIDSPPVRVTLFDKSGRPVAAKIARPADAAIPAGGRRHFVITLIDPPASARDLEIRFEEEGRGEAAAAARVAPAAEAAAAPAAPSQPAAAEPSGGAPHAPLSPAAASEHG